ncbi:MAG: phosphate acyltransferase PlsX [Parachlamydiales bacterium]|jgi:glycerol-3-phosphate acyltransferase PlsX
MNNQKNNELPIHIGIDLMGGENKPDEILRSIINFKNNYSENINFVFFATNDLSSKFTDIEKENNISLDVVYTEHSISMDENPLLAIRRKKKSTIFEGLRYLKDNKIDAFISCGNTGALTTGANVILNKLKSISRPALLALIPTKKNLTAILDVGANISFDADNLVQYAMLGAAFQKSLNINKPKVGILNIGTEQQKGTSHHQNAYSQLTKFDDFFNFVGNVEGKEVFEGNADVIVTDGFTGNVFLKTSEGLASFVLDKIYQNIAKEEKREEIFNILQNLKKRLYFGEYPGAILVGLDKIVIKCHGYSSIKGIISAIIETHEFVKNNIILSIKSYLQ